MKRRLGVFLIAMAVHAERHATKILLDRLDTLAVLIDEEKDLAAREGCTAPLGCDCRPSGRAGGGLKHAQHSVDATYDALSGWNTDVSLARNTLLEARRVMAG